MQKVVLYNSSDSLSAFGVQALGLVFAAAFGHPEQATVRAAQIQEEVAQGHRYVLAADGLRLVGFVSWRTWFEPRHRLAELVHIGALPGHGVPRLADSLVEAMELEIHRHFRQLGWTGGRKIILFTHRDNDRAQALYLRCGYHVEVGQDGQPFVWPELTREGVDELIMSKDFPEHRI